MSDLPPGRPHSGLSDPERFGLTYKQVVALIDAGMWRKFYMKWKRNSVPNESCGACGIPLLKEVRFLRLNGDKICLSCVEQIKEMAKR